MVPLWLSSNGWLTRAHKALCLGHGHMLGHGWPQEPLRLLGGHDVRGGRLSWPGNHPRGELLLLSHESVRRWGSSVRSHLLEQNRLLLDRVQV